MRDLFGETPAAAGGGEVTLALEVRGETVKAWLLARRDGRVFEPGRWIPKARVTRGEGREAHLFTMRRDDAAERGWV